MNKAVIMAGGFGTRLRPLTTSIPKPMVPILNIPMMEHIVDLLKKHQITDIVSLLYFQPDVITSHFEDGSKYGIKMNYVMAQADYGTAGAVKNGYEQLDSRFIIISGDVLTDFDLTKAIDFHKEKGAQATILLTRVTKPLHYGIVMTDIEGKIIRFLEKPSWGQVFSDTINTGIYILEPEMLDLIPLRQEFDFSKDLFPEMLRQKLPLYGYISDGYWRDVGNLNEYQNGQHDALRNTVKVNSTGIKKDDSLIGEGCRIAPTVKLKGRNIIGKNVEIGEHSVLAECVIGDNCKIGMGADLLRTTIWADSEIGDFTDLTDDVICSNVKIGANATIEENVFIAEKCIIGAEAKLNPNIKLWPEKVIEQGAVLSHSLVQEERWLNELFTGSRISGLTNFDIDPEFGTKLGMAIGMTFGAGNSVLVSRDSNRVSRIIKRSIAVGLASVGLNINDLQATSIPQTRLEILSSARYAGGFHVRKSPRYPNKTDIIIFNEEGRDIGIERTKKVERYFFGEDIRRAIPDKVGYIRYPERSKEIYIDRFTDSINAEIIRYRKFKILMDYSYGLAAVVFPGILGNMGVQAISMHDYVDPSMFKFDLEVADEGSEEMATIMRSLGYEIGFRMETGAEKISLIDERGVWFHPMRLLTIVTKLFLEVNKKRGKYKIAVSIVASEEIEQIAEEYDIDVIRVQNSHSAMMEATRDPEVLFVGGVWGGFIFSEFLFASDAMYTAGKILEMLAITGWKLPELDEALPRRYQYSINLECPKEMKGTVMRRAMEHSAEMKRELVEGVKIFSSGDSVLLIPEMENDAFTIIGESDEYDAAVKLAKKYHSIASQWRDDV